MGTIVNVIAIIIGSITGKLIKGNFINKHINGIKQALGLAILVIGLNGIITNVIYYDNTGLHSRFEFLIVVSLVLGVIIGEVLKIDDRINNFSKSVEEKFKFDGFSKSFITASLLYNVGALAIVGALNDGLLGDPTLLYVKSALDGITSIILAASLGMGVIFSSLVVLVYQGSITLLASYLSPYLQGDLLNQICAVGFVLVLSLALNLLKISKIKTSNFIPAMFVPIVWYLIKQLF